MFRLLLTSLLAAAVGGCAAHRPPSEAEPPTKEEAATGKADWGFIDWCDYLGWYGDGVCDDFCPLRDPDCEPPPPPPPPAPRAPVATEVVFVELMPNPAELPDGDAEWLELRNLTDETLQLAGCRLTDGGPDDHAIEPAGGSLTIAPAEVLLFAKTDEASRNGGLGDVAYAFGDGFSLNSTADHPMLVCEQNVVDAVDYSLESGWPFDRGFSMRLDPRFESSVDNDSADNWCQATEPYFGVEHGSPGLANLPCPVTPRSPAVGEVVFVELMPDPAGVSDFDGEWLELLNVADTTLEMSGCRLTDGVNDDHAIDAGSLLIAPGQRLLMAKRWDRSINGGLTDVAYAFGETDDAFSLNSRTDHPQLICDGVLVDEVRYDIDSWPFERGVAMQLDPSFANGSDNDSSSRWCASEAWYSREDRGTPGLPNAGCSP